MKFTKSIFALSLLMMGTACVSCSDDEREGGNNAGGAVSVDVKSVFTNGMPQTAGPIRSITLDGEGRVSAMTTSDANITFEYANLFTRATSSTPMVKMVVVEEDGAKYVMDMTLGSNGYVSKVVQTTVDPFDGTETDEWQFKYNSDGRLNYMKRSEGGNEETFITYKDGDITKVKQTGDDEEDNLEQTILYTSSSIATPIENKGCVMLFDETFGIDMDEMWYAYYAGLLGKATKHLPVGIRDEEETDYFEWTINGQGYPTRWSSDWGETFSFTWE